MGDKLWRRVYQAIIQKWDPMDHPRDKNGKFIPKGLYEGLTIDPNSPTKSAKAIVNKMLSAGYPMTKGHLLALLAKAGVTEKNLITAAGGQYSFVSKTHAWAEELVKKGEQPTPDDLKYYTKLVGGDMLKEILELYKSGGPKPTEPDQTPEEKAAKILGATAPGGGVTGAKQTVLELLTAGVPLTKELGLQVANLHGKGERNTITAIGGAYNSLAKMAKLIQEDMAKGIEPNLADPKYKGLGGKAYAEALVAHFKAEGGAQAPAPAQPQAPATQVPKVPEPTPAPAAAVPVPAELPADAFLDTAGNEITMADVAYIAGKISMAAKANGGAILPEALETIASTSGYHPDLVKAINAEFQAKGEEPEVAELKAKYLGTAPQTPQVPAPPVTTASTMALTESDFKSHHSGATQYDVSQDDINWAASKLKKLIKVNGYATEQQVASATSYLSPKLHAAIYALMQAHPGEKISLEQVKAEFLSGDLGQKSPPPSPPPATLVQPKTNEYAPGVAALPTDLGALKYAGDASGLGGFGQKHFFTDATGQKFLFKPALNKGSQAVEPFKAEAEKLGQTLAEKLYGTEKAVPTAVVELPVGGQKQIGTIQSMVPNEGNLKQIPWQTLTKERQEELLSHHVLDWTIGNFDNHAGQFMISTAGHVVGVDKEQAFRFVIKDPAGSAKMDYNYHPNAKFVHNAAEEPITNEIFRAFSKGQANIDLQSAILPALRKMEAISQEDFLKTITPFAVAAAKKYKIGASDIMKAALDRKNGLREQYREFFTKLINERAKASGQPPPLTNGAKFQFDDEIGNASAAGQALAKAGVLHPGAAAPSPAPKVTAKGEKPWQAIGLKADPVLTDMSVIGPQGQKPYYGTVVAKDSDMVEHQNVLIRKISTGNFSKQEGYETILKVTSPYLAEVSTALQKNGAQKVQVQFPKGTWTKDGVFQKAGIMPDSPKAGTVWRIDDGNVRIEFHDASTSMAAMRGQVRITYTGPHADGKKAASEISAALTKHGLGKVTADPTPEDDVHYRARAALRQANPAKAEELRNEKDPQKIYAALAKEGITIDQLKGMEKREVFPGHATLYDAKAAKEYEQAGAAFLFHGINGAHYGVEHRVVEMLQGGGLMATKYRYNNGVFVSGASSSADMGTGGADSVFVGLATKGAIQKKAGFNSWGPPYIIMDQAELGRRDWYARAHDTFGKTDPQSVKSEKGAKQFVESMNVSYYGGNEVMIRGGVATAAWRAIAVGDAQSKTSMVNALKAAGYKEINGVPVEKFVQVVKNTSQVKL